MRIICFQQQPPTAGRERDGSKFTGERRRSASSITCQIDLSTRARAASSALAADNKSATTIPRPQSPVAAANLCVRLSHSLLPTMMSKFWLGEKIGKTTTGPVCEWGVKIFALTPLTSRASPNGTWTKSTSDCSPGLSWPHQIDRKI